MPILSGKMRPKKSGFDLNLAAGASRQSVSSDAFPQLVAARTFGDRSYVGLSGLTGIGIGVDSTKVLGIEFENIEKLEWRLGDKADVLDINTSVEGLSTAFVLGGGDDTANVNAANDVTAELTFGVNDDTYLDSLGSAVSEDVIVVENALQNENKDVGLIEFDYQKPTTSLLDASIELLVTQMSDGDLDTVEVLVWGIQDGWHGEDVNESTATYDDYVPPLDQLALKTIVAADDDSLFDAIPGGFVDPIGSFMVSADQVGDIVTFADPKLVDFLNTDTNGRVSVFLTRADEGYTFFSSKVGTASPQLKVVTGTQILGGLGNDNVTLGDPAFQDSVQFDGAGHRLEQTVALTEVDIDNDQVITDSPPVFVETNRHGGSVIKPGDGPQGTLTSDVFTIGPNATITFDGAGDGGSVLLVSADSGDVLATAPLDLRSNSMSSYSIDATAHTGTSAYLQIVDDSSSSWGHVAVDNIHYVSDTEILWNFEAGSLADTTGTYRFTASEGSILFGQPIPYAPTPDNVSTVNPNGGNYHLSTNYYNGPVSWPDDLYNVTADDLPQLNEVQELFTDATSGVFTLTMDGQTTPALRYNATAAEVQSALKSLSTIGSGNVTVTGSGVEAAPWLMTFVGKLAATDVDLLQGNFVNLSKGSDAASITLRTTVTAQEQLYFSPETQAQMVFVVDPSDTRNLSGQAEIWAHTVVLDPQTGQIVQDTIQKRRIQQFDSNGQPVYVEDFEGGKATTTSVVASAELRNVSKLFRLQPGETAQYVIRELTDAGTISYMLSSDLDPQYYTTPTIANVFTIHALQGGKYAIESYDGRFLARSDNAGIWINSITSAAELEILDNRDGEGIVIRQDERSLHIDDVSVSFVEVAPDSEYDPLIADEVVTSIVTPSDDTFTDGHHPDRASQGSASTIVVKTAGTDYTRYGLSQIPSKRLRRRDIGNHRREFDDRPERYQYQHGLQLQLLCREGSQPSRKRQRRHRDLEQLGIRRECRRSRWR